MNTLISFKSTPFTGKTLSAAIAGALAVCTPLALVAPAIPAAAQSASQSTSQADTARINRAVRALRGISTMRADFTQTDRNGQVVTGVLTMKNPGRIRFEYEESVNMVIVSNGRSLTMADYDVQQLERWPISDTPLGALLDPDRNVAQYGRIVPSANPNVVSIAVTVPTRPEFGEIVLIFLQNSAAPGGLELVSWVANDSQNIRTTVRLRNHRYGVAVPDSTFQVRDPRQSSRRPR
ncbi:hypothetical protein GCM10009127_03640 [Alteraurantiacibacter aestuarii]|uniref:Outer membrane lipoprotein carrier protein LolA n=1 Tax=Alteraurantiacibacter aestuarii TaxID=650004 RepID=A0A844ZM41_9SPHN|nr:outer membrane lipoprotein carrier protein LolA [Alteraurantiacibacter aestuarii]MXO88382.1 outer membrane lipoprotein carrier protein LolA [Alteraurantiacibacter aestuarii]